MSEEPCYVDTHAHVQMAEFDEDRKDALRRCWDSGVAWIVCPGVDIATSDLAGRLAQQETRVLAAVGVHPEDCADAPPDYLEQLRTLVSLYREKTVAIGEIGLAVTDCLSAIAHFGGLRGVMHCFGGSPLDVGRAVGMGLCVSFTGNITYSGAFASRDALKACPVEHLLLETDSPYMPPVPKRGMRNEPSFVVHTYHAAASLLDTDVFDLSRRIAKTARELFNQHERREDAREEDLQDHAQP